MFFNISPQQFPNLSGSIMLPDACHFRFSLNTLKPFIILSNAAYVLSVLLSAKLTVCCQLSVVFVLFQVMYLGLLPIKNRVGR